jgi:NAD(P)H-dependent FMN reductase
MKIAVILGSARDGRQGEKVSKWVVSSVQNLHSVELKVLDLKDYDLPFMREGIPPRYNPEREVSENVQQWLEDIAWADAYILVTPEYNRSVPAELKNALDTIGHEGDKKPAMIVSYSGTPTGGLAAQQEFRTILNHIEMIPVPAFVAIPLVQTVFNEDGTFTDAVKASGHSPDSMLKGALDDLLWYGRALKAARKPEQSAILV